MRLRKKPWIEEAMQDLKGEYVLMHDLENYKGRWQELFPGKRLCLEIGCGKGRFIIGMAELHPEKAFIGVETQHGRDQRIIFEFQRSVAESASRQTPADAS